MNPPELDFGCVLKSERAPYRIPSVELSELESKALGLLFEKLSDEAEPAGSSDYWACLKRVCVENKLLLEKQSGEKIVSLAKHSLAGFGFLDFMLADDDLEEITVSGALKPIFVFHRRKGWLETNAFFSSVDAAINTVNKMARPLGRRITTQNPRLNAVLPDGSRLHASIAPVALDGIEITIRKFKRNPFNAAELAANGTISSEALAFLWLVLYGDVSLCVCGNTGSGKTTTLNALFSFIPLGDRIVVTEETPELVFPQKHLVKIIASEEAGVGMRDLVSDTLRMRPDRVVVGEVRTADETRALFDSLLAGQAKGSYFTFHAKSACEALRRLKALGAGSEELESLDLIVVQKRFSRFNRHSRKQEELRRVTEISEVERGSARALFEVGEFGKLSRTRFLAESSLVKRVLENHCFSEKEFWMEFERRKSFLEGVKARDYLNFTLQAQAFAFG